jgi:DNA-binding beta-propeller fold protein YncE
MRQPHDRSTAAARGAGLLLSFVTLALCARPAGAQPPRSPQELAPSPDGKTLALADRTARCVQLLDPVTGAPRTLVPLAGAPGQVCWSADGSRLFATESESRSVAEIDTGADRILRRLPAGPLPRGLALAPHANLLLIADAVPAQLIALRLPSGEPAATIPLSREPFSIAVTPDESLALVSNLLPAGSAIDPAYTAVVSLVDLRTLKCAAEIRLPPTSTCVRHLAISPDGRWAYVVHTLARVGLPAIQLERGWVNTDALSILDLTKRELYATVLLDSLAEGAADPWGVQLSPEGATAWISLAGVHQVARIDLAGLHARLVRQSADQRAAWRNDLAGLYAAGLIRRFEVPGQGPRGLALLGAGKDRWLAVALYFSGSVACLDPDTGAVQRTIASAPQSIDDARRGEMIFHDARYCFQHWLSCATCHPNDGRVDGLSWDLPADGIGNPKSVKSLLFAHRMAPTTWRGAREGMSASTAAGFRFQMHQASPEDRKAIEAYLASLQPEPSPYLQPDGKLTPAAARGRDLFQSPQTHCAHCHSGDLLTDQKPHDVGTRGPVDAAGEDDFYTPTLLELWRTAPYLHDGRAATLHDVFTKCDPDDRHGAVSHLSREQLDDLVAYLLSL